MPAAADLSGYARFVGRIGALAVALGVGAAVATGYGIPIAHADDTNQESPTGEQPGDAQPGDTPSTGSTDPDPAPVVTVNGEPAGGGTAPAVEAGGGVVPGMNVDSSGGYLEDEHGGDDEPPVVDRPDPIEGSSGEISTPATRTDTGPGETPAAPAPPTPPTASAGDRAPVSGSEQSNTTADRDVPKDGLVDLTVVDATPAYAGASSRIANVQPDTAAAQSFSTLIAPQPNIIEPEQPSLLAGLLTVPGVALRLAATIATGALAPFLAPGPVLPPQPTVLWAVLAWVRREIQRTLWNQTPNAVDNSVTTSEDAAVTIDVLSNDTDFDEDGLKVSDFTQPANGSVVLNPNGTLTYTPNPDFNGVDTFQYAVVDTNSLPHFHGILRGLFNLGHQDVATVTVTVSAVDDNIGPPVADNDSATVAESGSVAIDVLTGDTDPDGNADIDPTSVAVINGPARGTFQIDPVTGVITYTHGGSETLTDSFTYTVADRTGAVSNTATVTISITPVNDGAPVADDDSATVAESGSVAIDVLANDTDPDGNTTIDKTTVTIVVTSGPANGSVAVDPVTGVITYTHDGSETLTDSFTYTVQDTSGATSNAATVTMTVTPVNDGAPIADNDTATVNEGQSVAIDVLDGDTDPDGSTTIDKTTVVVVDAPSNGSITVDPVTGVVTYTHDGTETLTDTFTYRVKDNFGVYSNTATVTITVTPVNDGAPIADNDDTTVAEGGIVDIDVLANDTDPDGNTTIDKTTVTIVVTSGPANGSVAVDPVTGVITYTHDGSETLTDSFTYTVQDTSGATSNAATVTITITPVNDAPVANNDAVTTDEDTAVDINVLGNDSDPEGSIPASSVSVVNGPLHGTATVNMDGTVKYTPTTDYNGPDSFTYTLDDGDPATVNPTATVSISVTAVNDTPTVTTSTSTDNTTGNVTITVVVTDPDVGDARTITLSPPANGTGTVGSATGPTYDPIAHTYTYTAVYTPSPQARVNAYNTAADPDVDVITVAVSDGVAPDVTQTVSVPISPLAAANGGTITTSGYPAGIAISADGKRAYVANLLGSSVTVIDTDPTSPTYNQIVDTNTALGGVQNITVGSGPAYVAISPDGTRLYVTNGNSGSVSVVDIAPGSPNRYKAIDTDGSAANGVTNITVGNTPREIAISPDGTRAYVVNAGSQNVSVIDIDPTSVSYNKVVDVDSSTAGVDNVPVGTGPYAVAITPDGKRLFVTSITSTTVTVVNVDSASSTRYQVIDANGAAAGNNIALSPSANPNGIAISPDGMRAYVTNTNLDSVTVLDIQPGSPTQYQILDTNGAAAGVNIPVGDAPVGIKLSADGTRAYLVNSLGNTMTVLDIKPGSPTRYQVIDTNPTTAGIDSVGGVANPLALALTPDGTRAYVSNTSNGTVTVIYLAGTEEGFAVTTPVV